MTSLSIDTTIPSFYNEIREDSESIYKKEITVNWWKKEKEFYQLYISEFVRQELFRGDFPKKEETIKLVEHISVLSINDEISKIVEIYLDNKVMPKRDIVDAFHLAFASYYNINYLLTWNCNHLANANKKIIMKDHPIVKEVRKTRQKIAREYNFNSKKIAQAIKKLIKKI